MKHSVEMIKDMTKEEVLEKYREAVKEYYASLGCFDDAVTLSADRKEVEAREAAIGAGAADEEVLAIFNSARHRS